MSPSDRVKAHLEELLGPVVRITAGQRTADGQEAACVVATFADQPVEGAFTLVTVGLSEAPASGPEGETVRQELLVCGWEEHLHDRLYSLLFSTAQDCRDHHETADPGAVLAVDCALGARGDLRHAFLYPPTYFPDELATVPAGTGEDEIELVWLIPITATEAAMIETEGPEVFEDHLAATDPDLLDLGRS